MPVLLSISLRCCAVEVVAFLARCAAQAGTCLQTKHLPTYTSQNDRRMKSRSVEFSLCSVLKQPPYSRPLQFSILYSINLSKPTGYVMHQQFNIQQLYALPTLYLCVLYLSENSDLCHLQHKLIGFYNRDEKCLLHGTDWVFK